MFVVMESEKHTAFLQSEQFAELLIAKGAKVQGSINSATDIVVLGDETREKDWQGSTKKATLDAQTGHAGRKKALHVISFADFVEQYGMRASVEHNASIAQFDTGVPPPGSERTRGACFPRTLQWSFAGAKVTSKGRYGQFF